MRGLSDILALDLRFAVRVWARTPGVHAAIVLTLTLGIGATTAAFAVVNAVLLRPLPYADADRLVVILHNGTDPVSPANYLDWRRARAFSMMGAAEFWTPSHTAPGGAERLYGLRITPELLSDLGVSPVLGRLLGSDGDASHEVVIGHRLWQRAFGAAPGVIGTEITLDGRTATVVGVMPPAFRFAPFWATRAEIWTPLDLSGRTTQRRANSLRVFARLAPAVTMDQARAELASLTAALEREFPGTNRAVAMVPLAEMVVGHVRRPVVLMFTAVCLVLLIACANVAHMLLARSDARRREMAIRAALGAGPLRLARQLVAESALVACASGVLGSLVAMWSLEVVRRLGAQSIPRVEELAIDGRVLAFAIVASLTTALVFGMVPSLNLARPRLTATLRDADRGTTSRRGRRLGLLLVASEIACAVVLLTGAGLLIRSFAALRDADPGFAPDRLLSFSIAVTGTPEAAPDRRVDFYQRAASAIASLPHVERVSAINHVPLAGDVWGMPINVEGAPPAAPGEQQSATYRVVLPGYFATMEQRLIAGRDFTAADRRDREPVVIVNDFLARASWPGENPIGKRIRVLAPGGGEWLTVVGVAAHAVRSSWRDRPAAEVYLPLLQSAPHRESPAPHWSSISYVVRTTEDPSEVAAAVTQQVRDIAPSVPVSDVLSLRDVARDATLPDRFAMTILTIFAGTALVLASVGVYGVMSFIVAARRREIGIRLALGARPSRLEISIVAPAAGVAAAGAVMGLATVLALRRSVSGLLYDVAPLDVSTSTAALGILGIATVTAAWLPARRASRLDPRTELT